VPPLDARAPRTGARKCEANALVVQPKKACKLCLGAILKYLHRSDPIRYSIALREPARSCGGRIKRYGWRRATHDQEGRYLIRPKPNSNRDWN
jgi:hypothetical protein